MRRLFCRTPSSLVRRAVEPCLRARCYTAGAALRVLSHRSAGRAPAAVCALACARYQQHDLGYGGDEGDVPVRPDTSDDAMQDLEAVRAELRGTLEEEGEAPPAAAHERAHPAMDFAPSASSPIRLEKVDQPPSRFDLLTNSLVYRWQTTARLARRVSGPMREWATEIKYRTGVHLEVEPANPDRLGLSKEEGGYAHADDVEMNVYVFGSERGVFNCQKLMEQAVLEEAAYVRVGVFRRVPGGGPGDVEWLVLRRINRDLRPPDVPPISLKTPGKYSFLHEQHKEAALRSLWEETGLTVAAADAYPTARLEQDNPAYFWRVPVFYYVAEVPYEAEVKGPQVTPNIYVRQWDSRLLRQSPDPIDRTWAQLANPETGCAWLRASVLDELQRPLRGDNYMAIRYTPPPYSELAEVLGMALPPELMSDEARSQAASAAEQQVGADSTREGEPEKKE
ncbi:NUDIX hydrolase [Strigomonas culicis]|uniref:NUDIX hydrolase n=1 Tax=Strigomonas culicis TaxID=28005 RepID=S9TW59_9TRYP|nr:NUDIX hydrolase [Strigomonas culicis]EPY32426.1 NUDIX hydrolase [Strigomonas culicis]|eukprot:EPY20838.1 NUDIX hydrolase [Strigomonas culicis]